MSSSELKAIGERIKKQRKNLNLTQETLAEKMDVSIQMVSNLERGNKAIKIDNLMKLCEILNVSTDYILLGENKSGKSTDLSEKISLLNEADRKMIEMIVDYCLNK